MRQVQSAAATRVRYRDLASGQAGYFSPSVFAEVVQDVLAFAVICLFWGMIIVAALTTAAR